MPFDAAENRWKLNVVDESGQFLGGWVDPENLRRRGCPAWRSKPKGAHFEVLYQDESKDFLLLFRHGDPGKYEIVDADYFQKISPKRAAEWFIENGHEIPLEALPEPDNSTRNIPKHIRLAYEQYRAALDANASLNPNRPQSVYAAVKARIKGTGVELPEKAAWLRYVRKGKRLIESNSEPGADFQK
jgi:hypothetical protein